MKDGELRRVLKTFYPGRGFRKSGLSVRKTSLTKDNKVKMNEYKYK